MRMLPCFVLSVVLLVAADPSFAGLNRWTSSGPEGAAITSFVVDTTDRKIVFAGTNGGGVFRSVTGGEPQWTPIGDDIPDPMITALAGDTSLPQTLYAGTGTGRVFRSRDGGQHWSEVEMPRSGAVRAFAIDSERRIIYLATRTGLLITRDEGASWETVSNLRHEVHAIAVSSTGTVLAAMANPYDSFVSTDQGLTWQRTSPTGQSSLRFALTFVTAVAADPTSATMYAAARGVLLASSDNWMTSRALTSGVPDGVTALLPVGSRIYVATPIGLFYLEAGGTPLKWLGDLTQSLTAVAIPPSSPPMVYVGGPAGVFVAPDGGSAWQPANRGMNRAFVEDLALSGDGDAHAATPGGLFRNAGSVWEKDSNVPEPVFRIASDGVDTIYVSGRRGIRASTNRGNTWQMVTPRVASALAVPGASQATVYAALTEAIVRSTDGGRTFKPVQTGLAFSYFWGYYGMSASVLETDDEKSATAYVATDSGLFKTDNYGDKWTDLIKAVPDVAAVAGRSNIIHAALSSGVMTSVDGGASFSAPRLRNERVQALAIDPVAPQRSYAGTASGRVYRTDDFGNVWVLFGEGLQKTPVHRLEISQSGERIYAATAGGVYEYQIGTSPLFEQLSDDPLRLPRLIRQLLGGTASLIDGAGFVLPAVGTVESAEGSLFTTDVTLSNARETAQEVIVTWLPQGSMPATPISTFRLILPSSDEGGGTVTITDIADALGLSGLGSMLVAAVDASGNVDGAADIHGFARIRAGSCGSGSVSQSFAAVSPQGFAPHRSARALGLRHDSGYRTNVGIVNLSEVTREFTVFVDGDRSHGRFTLSVPPFSWSLTRLPDGNYGSVALTLIDEAGGAPWVAYGSSADNASRDAWASVAVPLREP
jgi:photosystem II stability/assembly factor-like uncharacterized protein